MARQGTGTEGEQLYSELGAVTAAYLSIVGADRTTESQGHDFLFSSTSGRPWDMNVYRGWKMMMVLLKSLEKPQAGFHAFRHFNVAMLDALRVH
jgi:hypothetical protein